MYGKDERLRDTYTRKEKQKKMVKSLMKNMVKKQELGQECHPDPFD